MISKAFPCILIGLSACAAHAGWFKAVEANTGTTYLDDAGPKAKPNGLRQVWTKTEFPAPRAGRYLSQKSLWVFNCNTERIGLKAWVMYAEHDGQGGALESGSLEDFQVKLDDAAPETVGKVILELGCSAPAR